MKGLRDGMPKVNQNQVDGVKPTSKHLVPTLQVGYSGDIGLASHLPDGDAIHLSNLGNPDGSQALPKDIRVRLKKKRRTKNDYKNKKFVCSTCSKAYYSYPALYTHKRNKHNIIPITCKQEIFTKSFGNIKFKYNALESSLKSKEIRELLLSKYQEKLLSFFTDPECLLYRDGFALDVYPGLIKLQKYSQLTQDEAREVLKTAKIDDVLSIYLVSFAEVVRKDFLVDTAATYCILLRTYLNTVGWDYKRRFIEVGVNVEFEYKGPYTEWNDCREIPDLINEFISVFVKMDERFHIDEKYLFDLTRNFCNWLFVNNLTNFKLVPNEENYIEENSNEDHFVYDNSK
jgi:hypothetical protein